MSLIEQNQRIVSQYRDSGQPWPATSTEIARWAIEQHLWQINPSAIVRQCADQISDAMREVYYKDPQGRRVRLLHPAPYAGKGRQQLLWDDMRTAPYQHMRMAFQNRRQQVVQDCHKLKLDADSYNQNYNKGKAIQIVLNFTMDVAELEALEEISAA